MIILPVRAEDIQTYWGQAADYLEKSCKHCDDSIEFVRQLLDDGEALLFLFIARSRVTGAMVLQVANDRIFLRHLSCSMPGGWLEKLNQWLKNMAEGCNLSGVFSQGRKGWQRRLKPLGWYYKDGFLYLDRGAYGWI